jgi:hypothetical protein
MEMVRLRPAHNTAQRAFGVARVGVGEQQPLAASLPRRNVKGVVLADPSFREGGNLNQSQKPCCRRSLRAGMITEISGGCRGSLCTALLTTRRPNKV